ncbi:MAG: hypothetical protein WCT03_21595 [Candidatus Obscuribacterales bacterium]|jgi:hypothetical protein
MIFKKIIATFILLISVPAVLAADGSKDSIIEPEEFSKLVEQKKYKEAHDTAVAEAKLVPEELEYVRGNKLVPYDKRPIYLRRALEYYEVLLATKEDVLAQQIEQEIFKTLPEKFCVDKMLEVSNRVNNANANKRLQALRGKCTQ